MNLRHPALRTRAMVAFGVVALLVSASVAGVAYGLTRSTLIDQRERSAERQMYLNARNVRSALASEAGDPAEALTRTQLSPGGVALLRVGDEWFSTSVSGGRADVPTALVAVLDEGTAGVQRTTTDDGPAVAAGVPLADSGADYVELVPFGDAVGTIERVGRGLLLAVAGAVAAALLAARWVTGRMLRPVRRTAVAATEIREGALDRRLDAVEDADLQPLVASFNSMVDGLQARIEREARFASDVSHELRSPLATMDAALSVARRRVSDPAAESALDALEAEVTRFRALIVDLLEIARAEAGVVELALDEIDPALLAATVVQDTGRESVVEVVVDDGAEGRARLDKRRIGQAVVNLLDNADAYGGGATRLTVAGDERVVRFVVDDEGPGVPDHEREYVFERFARGTTSDAPGTGLGLALVSEHVRLHGGTVTVSDAPGGGARFTIELPRELP